MSSSGQAPRSSNDPVRIVYHAGNRTFARLFNEGSLNELKDVVRRKLGLGTETEVSLKQMGSGMLLDLEDDGDFQAFRVLLKSSVSADIQVTVGPSQGSVVPPPVTFQPLVYTSASKQTTTTTAVSPSRKPTGIVTSGQLDTPALVAHTAEESTTKTKTPLARKRKAISDHADVAIPDEPTELSLYEPSVSAIDRRTKQPPSTTLTRTFAAETHPRRKPVGADLATSDKPTEQPLDKPNVQPKASLAPKKTPAARKTAVQKRKPSVDVATTEQRALAATPVASAKTVESPLKPDDAVEPPKKRLKKDFTKKKEAEPAEVSDSPAAKPPAPKPRRKFAIESKTNASESEYTDSFEPLVKKSRKSKDDGTSKKSFKSVNQDGNHPDHFPAESSDSEPRAFSNNIGMESDQVIDATLQPEKRAESSILDGISETRKGEKMKAPTGTACAAIPQTSASTSIQSEVAATILSSYLSKASEIVPPKPPQKRTSVKRVTKKSSASSSALPAAPTSVPDSPSSETRNLPAVHTPGQAVLTDKISQQSPDLNDPPCPICLGNPFHIRYCCPTVLKGPDAVRKRLLELSITNMRNQQSLIKQLEGLLYESKVSEPSVDAAPTNGVESGKISPPPNASPSRTPHIPGNSYLSEVTVEGRDEGSSSESSDDVEEGAGRQELPVPPRQKTPEEQPLPFNNDLEAIIRGPTPKQKSVLNLLDRIFGGEDGKGSGSEEDKAELEEDPDEEAGRSRYRSSRRTARSSDSESEGEESRSPSPSRSNEDALQNIGPIVQSSSKSTKESAEHQDGDVVMTDAVNPPVAEEKDEGSSEEPRPGSGDHMIVDGLAEPKGVSTVTEEQLSFPVPRAPVPQPSDLPSSEAQESSEMPVRVAPNQDGSVSVAAEGPQDIEADPIEPADDLAPPSDPRLTNTDPIETPSEDFGSLSSNATQSIPKPGVSKRIKTRNGEVLDKADHPVLLEQMAPQATDEVTPLPAKGKPRRRVTETSAPTRKSPRFSVTPSAGTPVPMDLLNHWTKTGRATKTPANKSRDDGRDDVTQNGLHIAPPPSLNRWEALTEPSSPSVQLDDPLLLIDELVSSSPHPEGDCIRKHANGKQKAGPRSQSAGFSQTEGSQEKERLFDLTPSQIPFPYSQKKINLVPAVTPNGKESEETDSEEEVKVVKRRTTMPARYRPLSQLASAAIFTPSLPTPSSRSVTNGKARKPATDKDSSSSSSEDEDEDEANRSEHIPPGRRAGSVLEMKRKSLLSNFQMAISSG